MLDCKCALPLRRIFICLFEVAERASETRKKPDYKVYSVRGLRETYK